MLRLVLLALALVSCAPAPGFSGDEVLGTFAFTAVREPLAEDSCAFDEAQDSFSFEGTFSRELESGQAYFTVNGSARVGTFDGQIAEATARAERRFEACACATTVVEETLRVALLSSSQDAVLLGQCPAAALDGGVPVEEGVDGGVGPPRMTATGFDAVRACGELLDILVPGADCACDPCRMLYRVEGLRR